MKPMTVEYDEPTVVAQDRNGQGGPIAAPKRRAAW